MSDAIVQVEVPGEHREEQQTNPENNKNHVDWFNWAYAFDWVILAAVFATGMSIRNWTAYERPIDRLVLEDQDLAHPHLSNIVSNTELIVYSAVIPLLVGILWYIALGLSFRGSASQTLEGAHCYILSLFLTLATTQTTTNFLKVWGGRFRPDFLSRCAYNATLGRCTGDPDLVDDGRKSFPSGHASLSFAGLGFLGLWIYSLALQGLFTRPPAPISAGSRRFFPHRPSRAWRLVLPWIPLLFAAYIGISRTQQYIHHPTDVLSGALLGSVIALIFYILFYRRNERRVFGYAPLPEASVTV
jgi:membrane-associated phospholipid phosphatase